MSRVIKFRAFIDGEMRPITPLHDGHAILGFEQNFLGLNVVIPMGNRVNCIVSHTPIEVMQFIGLHDKNGVEIYEGDIVKTQFMGKLYAIAVVEYDAINPCFVMKYKYEGNGHNCYEYDFIQCNMRTNEVIGNIHQNKELL